MHTALRHARSLFVKSRPAHLTFFVTRRCNATCPFCFYEKERDAEGGAPELSVDEIRRVARSMDRLLWVLFSGGEPFLREDLAEISGIFHDANDVGFLTYPTNGLLPEIIAKRTEEILERCPKSVVVVKLSLDGVGPDHDAIRRTPGGFDKVMRSYERLAALAARHRRLELGVNTLFCSENQWRMHGIVDFVRGLDGIRAHTITMVRGHATPGAWGDVDLGQYRRATAHLDDAWTARRSRLPRFAGSGLKAAQDRVQRQLVHQTLLERRRLVPCQAGRLSLVLSESGELYACEGRRQESLGNVRAAGHDVKAVLRSERARSVIDEIATGACHCSHECNLLINILFNPMMHPRLLREWARLRLGLSQRKDRSAGPFAPAVTGDAARRDGRQCA
jgi:MoaA/NifB/PqqE/SkfB family radical SAM enzyme